MNIMFIINKRLKFAFSLNIILIIVSFIVLLAIYLGNHNYNLENVSYFLFIAFFGIGLIFGLSFFVINIIILLKYKKIISWIISIFVFLWVINSYYWIFFHILKYPL